MKIHNVFMIKFSLKDKHKNDCIKHRLNWLNFRLKIFKTFTLKSLEKNTLEPDIIFLGLDFDDKDWFNLNFNNNNKIKPIFSYPDTFREKVLDKLSENKIEKNICFFRLDSDDAVSQLYIENINDMIRLNGLKKNQLFNIIEGYRTNLDITHRLTYYNSPFSAHYMPNITNKQLPLAFNHSHIYKFNPIYLKNIYWFQLVHGSNRDNNLPRNHILILKNIKYQILRLYSRYISHYPHQVDIRHKITENHNNPIFKIISGSDISNIKKIISEKDFEGGNINGA